MPALPRLRMYCLYSSIFWSRPGQIERDLRHVVHAGVADVPDRDAGIRIALLDLQKAFRGAQVGSRTDADVLRAHLMPERELLVRGVWPAPGRTA